MANVIKHKRGSGSDPVASDLVVGEVAIRTDVGKLFTKMDNGSVAEIAGGGSDIAINTLSSSSGTGGGSATFNGSAFRFTLSAPPSVSAQQLLVSINGVIQKPVAGTGQPSEGFSVDGTDIILGDAPATGSDFFILTFKSLGVSEPADNSVTSAKIVDGAIVNADINASAAIAGSKISPDFGSQNIITAGHLTIQSQFPKIELIDTNNNDDFEIRNANGLFVIRDATDNVDRLSINSSGFTSITGNFFVSNDFTLNGDLTIDTNTLHVDSSNNRVGIGTTSPSEKLHINSATTINGLLISTTNNNTRATMELNGKDSSGNQVELRLGGFGDTNRGEIFTVTNHDIGFATNNAPPQMVLNTSGNVGIGTTSPVRNLHIKDTSPRIMLSNDNTGHASGDGTELMLDTGGNFEILQRENLNLEFFTNNLQRMTILGNGNVGIGDTNPDSLLHIGTGTNTDDGAVTITIGGTSVNARQSSIIKNNVGGNDRALEFHATTASNNHEIIKFFSDGITERMRIDSNGAVHIKSAGTSYNDFTGSSDAGLVIGSSSNSNSGVMIRTGTSGTGRLNFGDNSGSSADRSRGFVHYTHSNDSMQIGTGSSERMRIDSSGRVLIGTTVEGHSTADDLTVATSGHTGISIRSGTSNNGNIYFSDGTSGNAELAGYIQYSHSSNSMLFGTNESNAMLIDSSGRVGIGTISPSVTLDIEAITPTIRLTDSDASGTPESEIRGGGGDLVLSADRDNEKSSTVIGFNIDGSEKLRIQTAGGISFNGDSAAANALNDYEEGYWSPVAVDGQSLSVTSGTSNHASRRYIKIGKMVTAWFDITWSSSNSSANFKTRFSGLPFSPESNTKRAHAVTFGIFTGSNDHFKGLVANINEDTGLVEFFKDGDELFSYSNSNGDRIAGFVTYTSDS